METKNLNTELDIIKKQKEELLKKRLDVLKSMAEQDKKNMETNYVSESVFAKKVIDYFTKNQKNALDDKLDIKDRIKSRMNAILSEYYMTTMSLNSSHRLIFDKNYLGEYRSLSYEYGKLIGLTDDEIINRGILKEIINMPTYVEYKLIREGKSIEDILDNYYVDRKNSRGYYAKRNESGIIEQPNIDYAYRWDLYKGLFDSYDRDILSKANIKASYIVEEKLAEIFRSFLDKYYKEIGYEDFNTKYMEYIQTKTSDSDAIKRNMQPEYTFAHPSQSNDIVFKSENECKLYDELISLSKQINPKPNNMHK